MKKPHLYLAFFLLFCLPSASFAQKVGGRLAVDYSAGYVLPSHKFLRGDNIAQTPIDHMMSAHLKYGFRFGPDTEFGRKFPDTYQGIGLGYITFFNDLELGSPLVAYAFQHSRIFSIGSRFSVDYEWNFGIACNWVQYDERSNPLNMVVGSDVTAYINLGLMMNWRFAPRWNWAFGADFSHCSTGNTSYPNFGINSMSLRTSVIHSFETSAPAPSAPAEKFDRHVTYDLILYGAWRERAVKYKREMYDLPYKFAVMGLNFNPLYNVCKYFRTGFSLDLEYDQSANLKDHVIAAHSGKLFFERPPFSEQFSVGVSARVELVMPIFSVNIGAGGNIYAKGDDIKRWYQILALKTSVTDNLYIHIGCSFNNVQDPRNLMLGLGYRFNSRK